MPISPSEAAYLIPPAPGAEILKYPNSSELVQPVEPLVRQPLRMPIPDQHRSIAVLVEASKASSRVDRELISEVTQIDYELDMLRLRRMAA